MTNQELLQVLKKEADILVMAEVALGVSDNGSAPQPDKRLRYLTNRVAEYNRQTLQEIKSRDSVDVIADIDLEAFNEFALLLNQYLTDNAPGQENLQRYVRLTATYLTFIARKPLHPPGLFFADGQQLTAYGNTFYCPVKNNKQVPGMPSLCQYCAAEAIYDN